MVKLWTYVLQMLLIFVLTLSLLVSDPLNYSDKKSHAQTTVPRTQWLTRLKSPLSSRFWWSRKDTSKLEARIPQFTTEGTEVKLEKAWDMYEFIKKYILTDDSTAFKKITTNYIAPHTRAMVLMGCYGDPTYNSLMRDRGAAILAADHDKAFMLNILLQHWEEEYDHKATRQHSEYKSHTDRSMCSCMKDFASPLLVQSSKSDDSESKFRYDTCLMQNLVDYTSSDTNTRQRSDPMEIDLLKYKTTLFTYYKGNHTYEEVVDGVITSVTKPIWENISMSKATKDHPALAFMQLALGEKNNADQTLKQFVGRLTTLIRGMYPHNKLRTPGVTVEPDQLQLSQAVPTVSEDSFALYMDKYRNALQICTHNGVPEYQKQKLVQLAPTKFWKLGAIFLIAAAMIGMSTLYKQDTEHPPPDTEKPPPNTNRIVLALQLIVVSLISITLFLVLVSISRQMTENDVIQKETLLAFFIALWWIFAVIAVVRFIFLFIADDNESFVWPQVSQDVCIIAGLANLGVSLVLFFGEGDEFVVTTTYVLFTTVGFLQHMSNLVRMMQLYTNLTLNNVEGHATFKIAYNRVLIMVLVGLALIAYVFQASHSVQTWSPGVLYITERIRLFTLCAFLIFSAFDVFFEVLVLVNDQVPSTKDAPTIQSKYEKQHPRKMMWTGWVIIVSLLVLDAQQYLALCSETMPGAPETLCNPVRYFFDRYDWYSK